MAGFVDLHLPCVQEKELLQKLVETAAHLGYSTVAIRYVVDYEEKKKEIVKPVSPAELFSTLPLVQGKSKPIKILSRLTLVVSHPSHCNILRATSTNIKFYDIFAVFPKNGKLFHVACMTLDVDLVCIHVTEKLPFYIKRPSVNVAMDRGIYFEHLRACHQRLHHAEVHHLKCAQPDADLPRKEYNFVQCCRKASTTPRPL
ncbi:hypothetical protein JRQ81_011742 [Phrynocephalus forsythii]|uniref:Uncharacterized protein n=1 Tax=Phrynocephalus forsythii TaxID=171643 RepID=A0A9Q0X8D7_9SAUR|nr:hypothetical protein JRQ81_011742 [Phrynocephalus forsythii]